MYKLLFEISTLSAKPLCSTEQEGKAKGKNWIELRNFWVKTGRLLMDNARPVSFLPCPGKRMQNNQSWFCTASFACLQMEKWKGHGITLKSNEGGWLLGEPVGEAGPCWRTGEWEKPYAGTSSWTCRLRVLWQRLISPRLSVKSKWRFMEILASAEGKYPEGWGRDQKCSKFHNHGNSKLSIIKRNFIPLPKQPESRSNLCLCGCQCSMLNQ